MTISEASNRFAASMKKRGCAEPGCEEPPTVTRPKAGTTIREWVCPGHKVVTPPRDTGGRKKR